MRRLNMKNIIFYATLSLSILFFAVPAHAQSSFTDTQDTISIAMRPEHPAPGESVHLSATSLQTDLERSDVTWYADNKVLAQGPGMKDSVLTAGPLGSETDIFVVANSADGTSASGKAFIRPTELDLLWESDSYVPPFYRGRAIPSAGTMLHLQAIPRFKAQEGTMVSERDIVYTWKRNGVVQQSASGRGKSYAQLPAPVLFGVDTIEVDASSLDGSLEAQGQVVVPSAEPTLALYEDHPLFGTMYHQALTAQTFISDSEMTFAAVPYFAQAQSPSDPRLIYNWKVNGRSVPAVDSNSSKLTINATGSSGLARIELLLTHAANWATESAGTWRVSFSTNSGSPGADPFGPTQ